MVKKLIGFIVIASLVYGFVSTNSTDQVITAVVDPGTGGH